MSKRRSLLLDEYPLIVLPSLAIMVGLNEAIVLQQIHFWLNNPKGGVEIDGERWVYNTYEEWQRDNFPFWSVRTVVRVFQSLEDAGLVISRQSPSYDRKKYYRLNHKRLDAIMTSWHDGSCQNGMMDNDKLSSSTITETPETPETSVANAPGLPLDWKIAKGEPITEDDLREEKRKQMVTMADTIAISLGANADVGREVALAFMEEMDIVFPESKVKRERKFIRDLLSEGVKVNGRHIRKAIQKMRDEGLTIPPRISSVSAVALALAVEPEKPESKPVPDSVLDARRRLEKSNEYN